MSTLGKELQQTILNLEKIRDIQNLRKRPSRDIYAKLDKLYEQQIDLIDAAIQKATPKYISATESMNKAAKKTQEAIDDLAKLEHAIKEVANAIGKVAKLLAMVA